MLVSIVIANWNGKNNLLECLHSLSKISYKEYEIIVVDNGSTDDSVVDVRTKFKKVQIVQRKSNQGFADANTIGYRAAKGDYILFLNNDTIVTSDFLQPLVLFLNTNTMCAVVQPKIVFNRPGHIWNKKINSVGSFFTKYGFLYHYGFGKKPNLPQFLKKMPILSAHGSCMLIKKSVLDKIGCFDPIFFAYFEETDLCIRVWLAGYSVFFIPDSLIFHKGAQTTITLPEQFIQFHAFKNRILSLCTTFEIKTLLTVLPLHILFCEFASVSYFVIGKHKVAVAVQKAIIWNLLHGLKILKRRKMIQSSIRKVHDLSFLIVLTRTLKINYFYHMVSGTLDQYN